MEVGLVIFLSIEVVCPECASQVRLEPLDCIITGQETGDVLFEFECPECLHLINGEQLDFE